MTTTSTRRFYSLGGINAATYDVRTETAPGEIDFYVARARASGGAVLELTAPRIPCAVFADRMGDRRWLKRFAAAERPGAYARLSRSWRQA